MAKLILFIFLTILAQSIVVSAPPSQMNADAPADTPNGRNLLVELFICFWALVGNLMLVIVLHRRQNIPEQQLLEYVQRNREGRNGPHQPLQQIQLNPRDRRNMIVQKYINLIVTILLFFVAMFLQYKYKDPEATVLGISVLYVILVFSVFSFFLKNFYNYGHLDFIMAMLSQVLYQDIIKNKRFYVTVILLVILALFAFDDRLLCVRGCCHAIGQWIKNCICGTDEEQESPEHVERE